jgi:tellurite methyltransferase
MSDWDTRYREGFYEGANPPHTLLTRFTPLIRPGTVIDIAAGTGRDILFLAERGYFACGLERSGEALKIARETSRVRGQTIHLVSGDASALPFRKNSASAVLVFYFLMRDIMGEIVDLLEKGGILVYETFLKRQNMIDRQRNPDYLLEDGELLSCFSALDLIFYEETISSSSHGKKRAIAQYVGRKR